MKLFNIFKKPELSPYAKAVLACLEDDTLEWEPREQSVFCVALNIAVKFVDSDVVMWFQFERSHSYSEVNYRPFTRAEQKVIRYAAWAAAARTLTNRREKRIAAMVAKRLDEANHEGHLVNACTPKASPSPWPGIFGPKDFDGRINAGEISAGESR